MNLGSRTKHLFLLNPFRNHTMVRDQTDPNACEKGTSKGGLYVSLGYYYGAPQYIGQNLRPETGLSHPPNKTYLGLGTKSTVFPFLDGVAQAIGCSLHKSSKNMCFSMKKGEPKNHSSGVWIPKGSPFPHEIREDQKTGAAWANLFSSKV